MRCIFFNFFLNFILGPLFHQAILNNGIIFSGPCNYCNRITGRYIYMSTYKFFYFLFIHHAMENTYIVLFYVYICKRHTRFVLYIKMERILFVDEDKN